MQRIAEKWLKRFEEGNLYVVFSFGTDLWTACAIQQSDGTVVGMGSSKRCNYGGKRKVPYLDEHGKQKSTKDGRPLFVNGNGALEDVFNKHEGARIAFERAMQNMLNGGANSTAPHPNKYNAVKLAQKAMAGEFKLY